MLRQDELERVWETAQKVSLDYPTTYEHLSGSKRLAVLHLLDEPVQSTLHQILQQNVIPGTKCSYLKCSGELNERGTCSHDCSQCGINVVDDIINCRNCDCFGFPCPSCHVLVFHRQLPMAVEDY